MRSGKAQLATVSNDELWSLYPDEELPQLTPSSVFPRIQLQEVLTQVRALGYATSHEESVGPLAVALPYPRRHSSP